MLAYKFWVGTTSCIYFSSWFASGKPTTLLQLHLARQLLGDLVAVWNTLPGLTPLQWPNWRNSMWRKWGSLSFEGLGTLVAQGVNVLGISYFRFYLLFIEVNKQLSTCVKLHLYSLYFYTGQMFIGVQINLFSQLYFSSSCS